MISIGRFTGLVGVVELLMFWICGWAGGVGLLPPPPPPQLARNVTPAMNAIGPRAVNATAREGGGGNAIGMPGW